MIGGIYRVDTATRAVTEWVSVPASLGGGGGVWGWGGTAFSPSQNALFAVTANAFSGGSNTGSAFSESAGYGEHLVELSPALGVISSSHPADITQPEDLDFVGSPVVVDRPGCGELVVAADKNDEVYGWSASDIDDGPLWSLPLQPFDASNPMLSQLAWSPSLDSIYAVPGTQLVRIAISASCTASVVWSRPLGTDTENGSPTIAGNTIWFSVNGKPKLLAYDARSGKVLSTLPLGGTALTAPTVVDGRLVIGTFTGLVEGFSFGAPARTLSSAVAGASASGVSWASTEDAWESRSTGVFSTNNAGRTWQEIYSEPALAVLRLSAEAGVIELGAAPDTCMCTTRALWTDDDGATWRPTAAIGADFTGGGGRLYWWSGGSLFRVVKWPVAATKISSRRVAATDGTIVDVVNIRDGVAAVVERGTKPPQVIVAHGFAGTVSTLPAGGSQAVVRRISVSGSSLLVTGTDYSHPTAAPDPGLEWHSDDSGKTWALAG